MGEAGGRGGGRVGLSEGRSIDDLTVLCGGAAGPAPLIGRPCHSGTSKPERSLQLWENGRCTSLYCTPLKKTVL